MGSKDLAEKNLLQYKDVFSDIVNVNLFGGRHYISANELSREPGELITKSSSDNKLKQLPMDVPMKCNKKYNTRFFVCLENQSDINNIMPVRDMGYQHAKYMEQVRTIKEANRQQQAYPSPITKEIHDAQKLDPVITLVLNYSQKEWKKPKQNEKGGHINMCVLLDMYEERGETRGIAIGEERGIHEINTLNLRLLDDNRLEDMQRAMIDTDYQKELMREYGIGK